MKPRLRISGAEARRFLRGLPKAQTRGTSWIVPAGKNLRVSQNASDHGILVGGLHRLGVLASVAGDASELLGYGEPEGSSAWELVFPEARFVLTLSPETWRSFSGEGALLRDLAAALGPRAPAIAALRAKLHWQATLDAKTLSEACGLSDADLRGALAALASRGVLGYDLASGSYFHRELPFDLDALEAMHPRLKSAQALVARGAVTELRIGKSDGVMHARVAADGGGVYDVTVGSDAFRCTCAWYGKHEGARGPCKHALAVQLFASRGDPS